MNFDFSLRYNTLLTTVIIRIRRSITIFCHRTIKIIANIRIRRKMMNLRNAYELAHPNYITNYIAQTSLYINKLGRGIVTAQAFLSNLVEVEGTND